MQVLKIVNPANARNGHGQRGCGGDGEKTIHAVFYQHRIDRSRGFLAGRQLDDGVGGRGQRFPRIAQLIAPGRKTDVRTIGAEFLQRMDDGRENDLAGRPSFRGAIM